MEDIIVNNDFTFKIHNGDFVVGDAEAQNVQLILMYNKGNNLFNPLQGVGITTYLNSPIDEIKLEKEIKIQFSRDRLTLDYFEFTEDGLNLDYSRIDTPVIAVPEYVGTPITIFKTVVVEDGQSIYDVAVQNYGNLESVFDLLDDNDLDLDSILVSGQELIIREGVSNPIANYLNNNSIIINNQKDSEIEGIILDFKAQIKEVHDEIEGNDGYILLVVEGGTKPYQYFWSTGAQTQNLNGLSSGTYSVTIRDDNNNIIKLENIVISNKIEYDFLVDHNGDFITDGSNNKIKIK